MEWPPKLPKSSPLTTTKRGYVAWIAGRTRWIAGKVPHADAIRAYHRKAAALAAGHDPMSEPEASPVSEGQRVTIHYVLARWLQDRRTDAEAGRLQPKTFEQYKRSGKRVDDVAGHWIADDWHPSQTEALYRTLEKRHGADQAKRTLSNFETACRHAAERDWCRPVRLGSTILRKLTSRPATKMKWKLYDRAQVRRILAAAHRAVRNATRDYSRDTAEQMRAMILLALNGGFGAKELSDLRRDSVDLDAGWIRQARGKTGVMHTVPMWPESIAALRPVLARRPGDTLVFRNRVGNEWVRQIPRMKAGKLVRADADDGINWRFSLMTKALGLKTLGVGFYKIKHLSSTLADAAGDVHATYALYGHSMGVKDAYVTVSDARIRAVVEHVRASLLSPLPRSAASARQASSGASSTGRPDAR